MNKTLWLTACLAVVVAACAETPTSPQAPAKTAAPAASAELDAVIANAEKEIAAAKKVGIWRDTEKFLKEAKEAKAAGKTDDAMKLAKKALKEAQLAQKQAAAEANAGPYYPK
jgi:hypothetical protein